MRKLLMFGAAALALGGSAVAVASQTPRGETFRMLELFGDVLAVVEHAYVVEVDNTKLIEAALGGMMTALDPHSSYLNADDLDGLRERTEGQYSGVGLEITTEAGLVKVISPMDEGPAARAGVQAGDVISAIDGQSASGLTVSQVSQRLRGAMGTSITVTFLRDGEEPREVMLTREVIRVDSVRGRMEEGFGVLRIATFNENTERELDSEIRRLRAENPEIAGWVLDLRNNGGGLLTAAIGVSDAFLERGEIVSQRGRRADQIERWAAKPGDLADGQPIVVLINYGSASASEIVAGALKDHERATILGLTSFGKGSVQTVIPMRGGQDGALSITTARYYTPSGASIQKIGIEPDLEVARNAAEARIVSRSSFIYSENAYATALDSSIGEERKGAHVPYESPTDAWSSDDDYQMKRALDLLRAGGEISRIAAAPATVLVGSDTAPVAPDSKPGEAGQPPATRLPEPTPRNPTDRTPEVIPEQ